MKTEKEMNLEEKAKYIAEYPLKTGYYMDDKLVFSDEDEINEALQGMGYFLVTGSEMMESTGSKVDEDGDEIVENGFYTLDTCDEEESVDSYSYVGMAIKEVIEHVVDWGILNLDYQENSEYEEIEVDGKVIEFEEVRRSSNLEKYEIDFNLTNESTSSAKEIKRLSELLAKRDLELEEYKLESEIADRRQRISSAKRNYGFAKNLREELVLKSEIKDLDKELSKYEEQLKELRKSVRFQLKDSDL